MRFSKSLKAGRYKTTNPEERSEYWRSLPQDYAVARRKMLEEHLKPRGIHDRRVLEIMQALPRHYFVDEALISQAYNDTPLNIGLGQTISQPFMVAMLAQALDLKGDEKVLEIGTGCGYQTAVLAALAKKVYSIERLSPLLLKARANLKRLGVRNVVLKLGDGSLGWAENAPYDAIVAAAVSPQVPRPFLDQLAPEGRLVMPVERDGVQYLILVRKVGQGFHEKILGECRFVKLIGQHGFMMAQ